MAELMDHVRVLADQIGPRPVSTEEEHQASLYIAQEMTDAGLQVDVDEFATPTGTKWPYAVAFLCAIVGTVISGLGVFSAALSTPMFTLGLLLSIAGLFIYMTERSGRPVLSKLLTKGVSQNVVARYVPSSVAREKRRRKLIIVAHVDTVRAEPQAAPFIINRYPLIRKVIYYLMIALLGILFIRMLPIPWPEVVDLVFWIISLVGCLLLLVAAVCIPLQRFMPFVAGANDNASAIAVMLGVAERLFDPAARERYAVEPAADLEGEDTNDEMGYGLEALGPITVEPVIHDVAQIEAAGVIPEGATVEYAYDSAAATTVIPPIEESLQGFATEEPGYGFEPEPAPAIQEPVFAAPAQPVAQPVEQEVPLGGYWPTPEAVVEPEPQPMIQPKPEPQPQQAKQAAGLPSWYTAAKEKAAKEKPEEFEENEEALSQARSRFADIPVEGIEVPQEQPEPEAEPEPESAIEEAARPVSRPHRSVDLHTGEPIKPAEPSQPETAYVGDGLPETASEEGLFSDESIPSVVERIDISDEHIDDAMPDLMDEAFPSGFEHGKPGILETLSSRLPNIGSSGTKSSEERVSEIRSELEEDISDSFKVPRQQRFSRRQRPTARHITEAFEPTKAVDDRKSQALAGGRQAAPVSSTYEDTPQAAPTFDPFAPKDQQVEHDAFTSAPISPSGTSAFPSLTNSFPAVDADAFEEPSGFAGGTSAFPSLTGSMPAVDAGAFDSPTYEETVVEDVAEDFGAFGPGATTEISIPESRFHSAVDAATGLFSRVGKKDKKDRGGKKRSRRDRSEEPENWDEDNDFGWKGGGYVPAAGESGPMEAARERAAHIREAVISMTESDLLDKEVWFVALGASSVNNRGMRNFLELHASELRGSLIINLEGVGSGDICFVDYEGHGKPSRSDRRLQTLVRKASSDMGKEMSAERLDWRDTDATPAMLAGMRAMTIMGFDGVAPASWHWATDTSAIVEEEKLEYVTRLLLKMIESA